MIKIKIEKKRKRNGKENKRERRGQVKKKRANKERKESSHSIIDRSCESETMDPETLKHKHKQSLIFILFSLDMQSKNKKATSKKINLLFT